MDHRPYRKHIRLPDYDYRLAGAYFITICTRHNQILFGKVSGCNVILNAYGEIVLEEWLRTEKVRASVRLDAFVIMPNHFHGILMLEERDAEAGTSDKAEETHRVAATRLPRSAGRGPLRGSVGAIVGQFKSQSSRRINLLHQTSGESVWQQNFYELIIRSDRSLARNREYIAGNPGKWHEDRYFAQEVVRV